MPAPQEFYHSTLHLIRSESAVISNALIQLLHLNIKVKI